MNSKIATFGLAVGVIASSALASNSGFKLNYTLEAPAGKSQNNGVALPYFYYPDGTIGNAGSSKTLCRDLNDQGPLDPPTAPKVVTVLRFDVNTDRFVPQSCTAPQALPAAFQLAVGEAYVAKPAANTNQVVNIVGSHDDEYGLNKLNTRTVTIQAPAGKSQNNWFSTPYHVTANDSKQLCRTLNGVAITAPPDASKIVTILRFDPIADRFVPQSCSSPGALPAVFTLKPGEGLVVKPAGNVNQNVSFEIY